MARDGLRASNSSLLAFAHLINGRLDKKKAMQPEAEKRCLYTLRDLLHVLAEQYARLAFGLAIHCKQNAIKALNLADKASLSKTPVTTDLFGGKWPTFKEAELTRRKERLEAEKAKKANQKKGGGAKGGSNQSFWTHRIPTLTSPQVPRSRVDPSRKEATEEVEEKVAVAERKTEPAGMVAEAEQAPERQRAVPAEAAEAQREREVDPPVETGGGGKGGRGGGGYDRRK